MLQLVQEIVGGSVIVINWGIAHKDTLLALAGGGAGLAITGQAILHKIAPSLANLSDSKRKAYAYTIVQLLAVIATIAAYIVGHANVVIAYPWLAAFAAIVHRYAVSPVYVNKVLPFLEFEAGQKAAAVSDPVTSTDASTSFVG